ncbi:hypothetical protein V5F77_05025 [Xanthobacter sp. DSM 24535]|uniref:hypothetical protein n=1 Tax=Roseixanthobacter psychrophilus TaxID=3119917 RepID=UPI003727D57E
MSWFIGVVLDNTPWWAWAIAAAAALAATYQLWMPLWALLPQPAKATLIAIGAAVLAYLAGRNRGAAGAVERERAKQDAETQKVIQAKRDIDDETAHLSDDVLDHDNAKWLRK